MRGDELGKWRMESGAWCMVHVACTHHKCIMYIINWELFFGCLFVLLLL